MTTGHLCFTKPVSYWYCKTSDNRELSPSCAAPLGFMISTLCCRGVSTKTALKHPEPSGTRDESHPPQGPCCCLITTDSPYYNKCWCYGRTCFFQKHHSYSPHLWPLDLKVCPLHPLEDILVCLSVLLSVSLVPWLLYWYVLYFTVVHCSVPSHNSEFSTDIFVEQQKRKRKIFPLAKNLII